MSTASHRLSHRQGQALTMTPLLRESLKLLELSGLELRDFVEQELAQNPLLERDDSESDGQENGSAGRKPAARKTSSSRFNRDIERVGLWRHDSPSTGRPRKMPSADREITSSATTAVAAQAADPTARNLNAHLMEQINIDLVDPADRAIGMLLLEQLDESGYLAIDVDAVGKRLNCSIGQIEKVVARLQQFDPPGIFAGSLSECLRLQLRDHGRLTPAMGRLLENLHLLAKGDRRRLMDVCAVNADELSRLIAEIRTLNPRPAAEFGNDATEAIVPDIVVRPDESGGWLVELPSDRWPRLLVNHQYVSQLRRTAKDKTTREFVTGRLAAANWLIRSLQRRNDTLLTAATAIVNHQDGFLCEGALRLRPLTRRDLARSIDVHESTVSRVTANKFMSTPRGVFALGYFFGGAIAPTASGPGHAAESVRARIRTLVRQEGKDTGLTDQLIVQELHVEGIEIARRTVAKYRKSLGLATAAVRRHRRRLQGD
ncbi:MAG: RNA polymerase factor sigma-54 [Dongiaceae bacterium]